MINILVLEDYGIIDKSERILRIIFLNNFVLIL